MFIPGDNAFAGEAAIVFEGPPPHRVTFGKMADVRVVWMHEGNSEYSEKWEVTATNLEEIREQLETMQAADRGQRRKQGRRQQPRFPAEIPEVARIKIACQWDDDEERNVYKPLSKEQLSKIDIPKMRLKRERLALKNEHIYRHTNNGFYEMIQDYLKVYDRLISEAAAIQGLV